MSGKAEKGVGDNRIEEGVGDNRIEEGVRNVNSSRKSRREKVEGRVGGIGLNEGVGGMEEWKNN